MNDTNNNAINVGADQNINPVDYAIISQGLVSVAREMGVKLVRSAFSSIVREAADASASLLDQAGNVVSQAELIPMQLGPMSDIFKSCSEAFPINQLVEGDFYITNDPFSGGQHLPDIFIFLPVFYEGVLVAFAATVAHHIDLGGGNPGLTCDAADIHAEGFRIPPSKYNLECDWNGGNLERLFSANIRVPTQTIGDINAQFAASAIGIARVRELCRKYGIRKLWDVMREFQDYSERRFVAALGGIAEGEYYGEDAVDDDGLTDDPLRVCVKLTVKSDSIEVNFAGTCRQVSRNLNCPLASTKSAAISAIKSVLTDADIPFNEGVKRPIKITAPIGSLLNPTYPAPVRARMEAGYRAYNAVMKALSQATPNRVIAGGADTTTVLTLGHFSEAGYSIYMEVFGGGYGASPRKDGCNGVDAPLSNCANIPIESADLDYRHFRIIGYGLLPDSGGKGTQRGGLGFFRRFQILADKVNFATYSDRYRIAPYGLFGGDDGSVGRCELLRNGKIKQIASKDALELRKGDILTIYTPGGGGYGDPSERSMTLIENDKQNGYVSS